MAVLLTDLGRRVLAHVPDWAPDEAAQVAMEGGPENAIRARSHVELADALAEDPFTGIPTSGGLRALTVEELASVVSHLLDAGLLVLCEGDPVRLRMTQAGRDALTEPDTTAVQAPGAAVLDVAPLQMRSGAGA